MMLKRIVLTRQEAAILTAFRRDQDYSVPELVGAARLSVSELRDGLARLQTKGFVSNQGYFVRLTQEGIEARNHLIRNPGTVFIA